MIEAILLVISLAVLTAIYYLNNRKPKQGYIWVGNGENPFKN